MIAALCAPACANVLGVSSDPPDVVVGLCGCPAISAIVDDCEQTLDTRLSLATSDVRAAWLATYSDDDCTLCENASRCFYTPPTCVASGNPCTVGSDCCAWTIADPLQCDLAHGSVCK